MCQKSEKVTPKGLRWATNRASNPSKITKNSFREACWKTLRAKCCTRALSGPPPTVKIMVSLSRNHRFHISPVPRKGLKMGLLGHDKIEKMFPKGPIENTFKNQCKLWCLRALKCIAKWLLKGLEGNLGLGCLKFPHAITVSGGTRVLKKHPKSQKQKLKNITNKEELKYKIMSCRLLHAR